MVQWRRPGELAVVVLCWLVAVCAALGQWILLLLANDGGVLASQVVPTDLAGPLASVVLASFGALVVRRGDSPLYGWLLVGMGTIQGVVAFAGTYSLYALETSVPGAAHAVWIQDLWMLVPMTGLLLLPALFPDGRVASPRWRVPVRMTLAAWIVLMIVFAITEREATNFLAADAIDDPPLNATGVLAVPELAYSVAWLVVSLASIGIGIGSLVTRWRRSDFEVRQRIKWVLYAFGVLLAVHAFGLANQVLVAEELIDIGLTMPLNVLRSASVVGVAVAVGLAMFRYRLYEIDAVINRTIVYGGLTVLSLVIYVSVVVGVGALLPIQDSFAALTAAVVVAVAFAPLRQWMQAQVNRLMFGHRDEPYRVLTEMGRILARSGTPDVLLQALCETVATSLRLRGVAVELEEHGDWRRWASHGRLDSDGEEVEVPLRHRGEVVGRLVVAARAPCEPLSPRDFDLLESVGFQAGSLVRAVRLTTALQVSRERLVLAREEERRRIRRDLHDEVGPTLASQTLQFDSILECLREDPDSASVKLASLKEQNKELVADIRRLVYELRPPALDELGVAGALAAHGWQLERAGRLVIDVRTEPDPLPRLPAAVEVAAYRIAREAITNTVRHADASRCVATLEADEEWLRVTVSDDGIGVDEDASAGMGLTSMRERTEELGGSFGVTRAATGGTRVLATIPLADGPASRTVWSESARSESLGEHGG